jgi:hypothetical protein
MGAICQKCKKVFRFKKGIEFAEAIFFKFLID